MIEPVDPLEAELASLMPRGISARLRRNVAQNLVQVPSIQTRRVWWLAATGGLAAACLGMAILWWVGGRGPELERADPNLQPTPVVTARKPDWPIDSGPMTAWRQARVTLDEAEIPPFDWPVYETQIVGVTTAIPSTLLD